MKTLRIMSFNLRGATYNDGDHTWDNRKKLVADVIKEANADVICFQELQLENIEDLADTLATYDCFMGNPYNRPARTFFNAIFYKPSIGRLMITDSIYLSETPMVWSKDWKAARVHTMSWIEVDIAGHGVIIANTHLDHKSSGARTRSASLISRTLGGLTHHAPAQILVGDFNDQPSPKGSSTYGIFKKAGFKDAMMESGSKSKYLHTFHDFNGDKAKNKKDRIDWALVNTPKSWPYLINQYERIDTHKKTLFPSDHYPILVELGLRVK